MVNTLDNIKAALIDLDIPQVASQVRQALAEGLNPETVLEEGLIAGMNVIGERFKEGELFMPEILVAAKAMHAGMEILKPLLAGAGHRAKGTVVIGTIQGDLHDIGKNLVAMMLEGAGFSVVDLGVDVSAEAFAAAVETHRPQVVGLSCLLTSTMPQLPATIQRLAPWRPQLRIVVGGAPVTQAYAEKIGADGYAPNAAAAVDKVRGLMAGG
jgi:5-methyltetrahydrofolate--homocysteine methyltransferase